MATYQPRLNSNGMQGSKYWYTQYNIYFATGYGMPNCTCYAFGRFWEINGHFGYDSKIPKLPNANGEDWWSRTYAYEKGSTPKVGSIICFRNTSGFGAGHVAVVEEVRNNGVIVTSNSSWQGKYFYTETLSPDSNGYYYHAGSNYTYRSQGFIYNPYVGQPTPTPPTPTPTTKKKKFPWVLYAKRLRR